jgi:hypothetical protein
MTSNLFPRAARRLGLAALPAALALFAAPAASADEVGFGLHVHDGHVHGGVGVRFDSRPAPVVVRPDPRLRTIPAHEVVYLEEVCEPAVYGTRRVPVYEDRVVPVYETVYRPAFDVGFDTRRGGRVRAHYGTRAEVVQVGTRVERVRVGDRVERYLVREATCRTVERREWVPARTVLVTNGRGNPRDGYPTMRVAEYEAEMAAIGVHAGGVRRRTVRTGFRS